MSPIDETKLHAFIGKMLGDLGGAMAVPTVRLGLRLGLFEALAQIARDAGFEQVRRATEGPFNMVLEAI